MEISNLYANVQDAYISAISIHFDVIAQYTRRNIHFIDIA